MVFRINTFHEMLKSEAFYLNNAILLSLSPVFSYGSNDFPA
jgi:hypothetical protein